MHHSAVYQLKLVAAPFSNQEGEWFWNERDMRRLLSRSRLYMIGQHEEVFFRNVVPLAGVALIFDLQCGNTVFSTSLLVSGYSRRRFSFARLPFAACHEGKNNRRDAVRAAAI